LRLSGCWGHDNDLVVTLVEPILEPRRTVEALTAVVRPAALSSHFTEVKTAALVDVRKLSERSQALPASMAGRQDFETAANNIFDLFIRLGAGASRLSAPPRIRENDFKYRNYNYEYLFSASTRFFLMRRSINK
jgi:hypothetical protein